MGLQRRLRPQTAPILLILASAVLSLFLGYALESFLQERIYQTATNNTYEMPLAPRANAGARIDRVRLALPAVDNYDNGVLGMLEAEGAWPGHGAVFTRVDSKSPLINPDTQASLRTANEVAKAISSVNASKLDVYYSLTSDSELVGGKSAGAAITIATLALLTGSKLQSDVTITGTVESDGRIGPVGKIIPKAKAAKNAGFKSILVPPGESVQQVPKEYCKQEIVGNAVFRNCRVAFEELKVSEEAGILVVEVATVLDAFDRMRA